MNTRSVGSLLVFADDWGRHPSSCQHLIGRLLPRHPAVWVNTIGTRRPSLSRETLQRGIEKVKQWTCSSSSAACRENELPEQLTLCNPKMWPWFSRPHDRWLNRRLLERSLRPLVDSLRRPVVGVTTIPLVADLLGRLDVDRWVYYCVDDFSRWPGLDSRMLETMEGRLVAKVDALVAAGEALQARLQGMGREAALLTHGVDLQHWQRAGGLPGSTADLHAALGFDSPELLPEPPWIVFWGVIDQRMDVQWLAELSRALQRGTILLVGPQQQPDARLRQIPRVVCGPALPYDLLPELARRADVLIMPYRDLPVTRAMQPLKLKEYLATDRPVVCRDLPAVRPWADALDSTPDSAAFAQGVLRRLASGLDDSQREARLRLERESWQAKASEFETHLFP